MEYKNEGIYDGTWKNNQRSGEGTYEWINGDIYVGTTKFDKRDGFGKMYYKNGDIFEGFWKNGMKNGKGIIIFKDDERKAFCGYWIDDLKCGKSIMFFNNGTRLLLSYEKNIKDEVGYFLDSYGKWSQVYFNNNFRKRDKRTHGLDILYETAFGTNCLTTKNKKRRL